MPYLQKYDYYPIKMDYGDVELPRQVHAINQTNENFGIPSFLDINQS